MAKSKFEIKEIKPNKEGIKYVLEMDGIKNIGNKYAFSEEELTELWLTITRVLDTTKK